MKNYTSYTKKAVATKLDQFCYLAKEHDMIEVTEWESSDGIDITIIEKTLSLTWGELKAINKLSKALKND